MLDWRLTEKQPNLVYLSLLLGINVEKMCFGVRLAPRHKAFSSLCLDINRGGNITDLIDLDQLLFIILKLEEPYICCKCVFLLD